LGTTRKSCNDDTCLPVFGLPAFLCGLAGQPPEVAAIAPSGAALAELITRDVRPGSGPVLELGPGTGAFTRALLARGVDEASLVLVEPDARFAQLLQRRYPRASIHQIDAAHLGRAGLAAGAAEAVVSGLPLLAMPPRQVMAILAGAFGQLAPQGCFYQFTYGVRCPVPRVILDRLGLEGDPRGPHAVQSAARDGVPVFTPATGARGGVGPVKAARRQATMLRRHDVEPEFKIVQRPEDIVEF